MCIRDRVNPTRSHCLLKADERAHTRSETQVAKSRQSWRVQEQCAERNACGAKAGGLMPRRPRRVTGRGWPHMVCMVSAESTSRASTEATTTEESESQKIDP
eukprot:3709775-Rhodomonas_salina.2